jgi:alpha-L-fucosidase
MKRHRDQLKEILTNYGKIDMVCLDMWLGPNTWPEMRKTMLEIRKIQPDVMFRCRNIGNYGDYYTPERFVPGNVEATNMPWFVIYPLGEIFAYDPEAENYKSGHWIINNVIDATSKGGNFMVCIGPDRDGVFHPTAMKSVEDAGDWLRLNGEAIFETRPWAVFGEGPTARELVSSSTHDKKKEITYSFVDIRFTRSKDRKTIYAILMGWPGSGQTVTIKSFSRRAEPGLNIDELSLIGYGDLKWTRDDEGLKVTFPSVKPCDYAYTLRMKITE